MKKKRNNKRKVEEEEDMFDFEDEFEDEFEDDEDDSSGEKKQGFFSKLFGGGDEEEFEDEFDDEFEEEEKPVVRRKKPIATPPPKKKRPKRKVVEEEFEEEFDDEFEDEFEEEEKPVKIALGVLAGLAILFLAWVMWPADKKPKKSAKANTQVNAAANLDNLPAPTSAQGHSDRAQAYFNIQNYDKALVHLNQTIAIDDNFEDIHRNKGMLYSLTNRHDLAIPEFDTHLQTKPDDFIVYHWRGIAKFNVGQFAEAIADFSEVINRDAPKGEYLVYRSQAHNSLGNKKEAIADVKQAQSLGVEIRQEYLDELQAE